MPHIVTCVYCKKKFDRDKHPFVQVSARRYAHPECSARQEQQKSQELIDKENLEKYIINLLKIDYIDARIRKQINQYIEDYQYTYSGIHKALIYFFEIKGNSIEKANGGIGIVPYIYKDAYNYYRSLWEAQQKNKDKDVEEYIPKVKKIIIPRPQRKIKKRELFKFLDEETE